MDREELRRHLILNGHTTATASYDGYGDRGDLNEISHPETEALFWDILTSNFGGWENNDGGNGSMTWDLATDVLTIDHNQAFTDYENEVRTL